MGNSSTASDESSFQSRSGLVEDIYDYTNDFGQKNPSQGSTTTEHSLPTLPPLYPRDQPHALVPFEEIKPEQVSRKTGKKHCFLTLFDERRAKAQKRFFFAFFANLLFMFYLILLKWLLF